MRTMNCAMSDVSEDASATTACGLIAPSKVMAAVSAIDLELGSVLDTILLPPDRTGYVPARAEDQVEETRHTARHGIHTRQCHVARDDLWKQHTSLQGISRVLYGRIHTRGEVF
jgi:uncharacterized protein YceK